MNPTQRRLASLESWPAAYKRRVMHQPPEPFGNQHHHQHAQAGQPNAASEGDFCSVPIKARNLLMNKNYSELNIQGRAGDFRSEVEWRLLLRDSLQNPHLPTRLRVGDVPSAASHGTAEGPRPTRGGGEKGGS